MTGAVGLLIKLGVRLVVFGLAFFIAAKRNPKVILPNKWATPLIALTFATLNTAMYWVLSRILDVATLNTVGFLMPLIANLIFLLVTVRIFRSKKWIEIQGIMTTLWMAVLLTVVHGLCWVGLDYLPKHV